MTAEVPALTLRTLIKGPVIKLTQTTVSGPAPISFDQAGTSRHVNLCCNPL